VVEMVNSETFKDVNQDMRQRLKSESELYERVRNTFDTLSKRLPHILTRESDDLQYVEREVNGRKLYVLGEKHYSITPVDFVHENLAPKIAHNPKRWLMLLESVSMKPNPLSPSHFYLRKLAKLFNITCKEALVDLYAPDTIADIKNYIQKVDPSLGANDKKLDEIILLSVHVRLYNEQALLNNLVENGLVTEEKAKKRFNKSYHHMVSRFSKNSGMPEPYVNILLIELALNHSPETERQFVEFVVKPWNELTRERFYKLLEKYSDKSEVLVNVGIAHLPAFL
jgi:hypothetical protein